MSEPENERRAVVVDLPAVGALTLSALGLGLAGLRMRVPDQLDEVMPSLAPAAPAPKGLPKSRDRRLQKLGRRKTK